MRSDLERQIREKKKLKSRETEEDDAYFELQTNQNVRYDQREDRKFSEMKKRVMLEKLSGDKQLDEDNQRRRHERRKEKELDERMVQ